jgi:HTH-type transcriptional regulator, competence development regulator
LQAGKTPVTTFGQRLRELRQAKKLGQRPLAAMVGIAHTYLSRVENENLDFGPYPSEELIVKLADVLGADADELLILANKIPPTIRKRVKERPDAFRKLASLDDKALDAVLVQIGESAKRPSARRKAQ